VADAPPDAGGWVTVAGAVGGVLGAMLMGVANVIAAWLGKSPAFAAVIERQLETLIKGYESRIKDLEDEIVRLRKKVAELEKGKCQQ
jgi:hypothetical protein